MTNKQPEELSPILFKASKKIWELQNQIRRAVQNNVRIQVCAQVPVQTLRRVESSCKRAFLKLSNGSF
jgi:hypothetical protein